MSNVGNTVTTDFNFYNITSNVEIMAVAIIVMYMLNYVRYDIRHNYNMHCLNTNYDLVSIPMVLL